MTASPEVRDAARQFMAFAALAPAAGVLAYAYDGIFIGATWARDMRNLMIAALALYFVAWWTLLPFGNSGLWLALLGFLLGARTAAGGEVSGVGTGHVCSLQLTHYESILIITIDEEAHPSFATAVVGRREQTQLPGVSRTGAGWLRFRALFGTTGQYPPSAKLLKGFGSGTVELIGDFDGYTYRAVYTARFRQAVYVLHAFKKKSRSGIVDRRRAISS